MARNRMIKPDFFSNESLMRVSLEARLLFIGTWCFADDYGFFLNSPRRILGDIFPVDESVTEQKIQKWISELVKEGSLIPIEYKNKRLLFVKGWHHQKVAHKSKRSHVEIDDIEPLITRSLESHENLISIYLESHAPKRKKKEESNKEKEKVKKAFAPYVLLSDDEYMKVLDKFGNFEDTKSAIDKLNNYKASSGKEYKSDYHALIGWVFDDFQKKQQPKGILMPNANALKVDDRETRSYGL